MRRLVDDLSKNVIFCACFPEPKADGRFEASTRNGQSRMKPRLYRSLNSSDDLYRQISTLNIPTVARAPLKFEFF